MAREPQNAPLVIDDENFELTDEDLEMVVGGLSPEASLAQARHLRDSTGDSGGGTPSWLAPTPGMSEWS